MSERAAGASLVAVVALLFRLAWWLMPAVGITDTREIFERVAAWLGAALVPRARA